MIYYNDNDPAVCRWLIELIEAGLIPKGDVDDRNIKDVKGDDLEGYTQCHFFAGIGGWARALTLAGWPSTYPVWTGSCPCQPFSVAGLGKGAKDERHLWPEFARLICECEPPIIFGEQVASKLGREWLAGVRLDLEAMGYAVGAADLCAACVGAPHIRQRLWWVADSESKGDYNRAKRPGRSKFNIDCDASRFGCPDNPRRFKQRRAESIQEKQLAVELPSRNFWADSIYIPCGDGKARRVGIRPAPVADGLPGSMGRSGEKSVETIKILTQKEEEGHVMLLKGYGNSIVPQVAAEFIKAFKETRKYKCL